MQEARKAYPSLWSATETIAPKVGGSAQTLNDCVKKHEIEVGIRDDLPLPEREQLKALDHEVKELRQANATLLYAVREHGETNF